MEGEYKINLETEAKIKKQFTKFLYPFHYDAKITDLDGVTTAGRNGDLSVFVAFSQQSEQLRGGLAELLSMDGGSAQICKCYKVNDAARSLFSLPKRASEPVKLHIRQDKADESHEIRITDLKIYLFESEVGFAEVEIECVGDELAEVMDCNYFIGELKSEKNYFTYKKATKTSKDSPEIVTETQFALGDLFGELLKYVGNAIGVGKSSEFLKSKALIFSYVLFDKEPRNIGEILFNLRENYKQSYKAPQAATDLSDRHVCQQFGNSYFGASYNGAVNVSYMVDDDKTNNFFADNFYSSLKNTYYSLFLNVLHQRYAIMKFIRDMGHLDQLENDYEKMKYQLRIAKLYQAKIANLKFRDFFLMPSLIEHVNNYFNLLYKTFEIAELERSLNTDLSSIAAICETYVQRIKEREKTVATRKKAKIGIFVSLFGMLVGVMDLIDSYWSVLEKSLGWPVTFFSPQILLIIGLLLLPVVTVIVQISYEIADLRKKGKALRTEEENDLVEEKYWHIKKKSKTKENDTDCKPKINNK